MKYLATFLLAWFPLVATADDVPVNIRLRALAGEHAEGVREATKTANARYLEALQILKQQRIRNDDLRAAIVVDDEIKRFKKADRCGQLIARVAGIWKFTTTGNTFQLFADGSAAAPDGKNIGNIEVVDLERRILRLSGIASQHTWKVSEDANALLGHIEGGSRHPARRLIDGERPARATPKER